MSKEIFMSEEMVERIKKNNLIKEEFLKGVDVSNEILFNPEAFIKIMRKASILFRKKITKNVEFTDIELKFIKNFKIYLNNILELNNEKINDNEINIKNYVLNLLCEVNKALKNYEETNDSKYEKEISTKISILSFYGNTRKYLYEELNYKGVE